jgi:hypothetical protein
MKIFSIQQSSNTQVSSGHPSSLIASRVARWGTVVLCAILCASANAQSGLLQTPGANPVQNGLFVHGDDSYRVVNTGFRTAADIGETESGSVQQVGFRNRCGSCGTSCGGLCRGSGYVDACAPCNPYEYALVEGLYMQRDGDDRFTLSQDFDMGDFDFEFAPRITIGMVPDCVHGYEVSWTGPFEWDMSGQLNDAAFDIQTLLTPGLPVAGANLSTFSDATFQRQTYSVDYWSLEANKTLHGWDMAKLLAGFRYINYDEDYNYLTQNATGGGLLRSAVDNQLFGLQVGMDLLFPVCCHGYSDFRARAGGFVNSVDSDVRLINAGSTVIANFDDDTELAGIFEIGSGFRYQVGEILSLRAGVELWYLTGVATAPNQLSNGVMRPSTGRAIQADEDILFTGFTVGGELKF